MLDKVDLGELRKPIYIFLPFVYFIDGRRAS